MKVVARRAGDKTYVIAVNAGRVPIDVQIHVPALRDGTVKVFGEKRSLSARNAHLADAFPPLGVHIYVQRR